MRGLALALLLVAGPLRAADSKSRAPAKAAPSASAKAAPALPVAAVPAKTAVAPAAAAAAGPAPALANVAQASVQIEAARASGAGPEAALDALFLGKSRAAHSDVEGGAGPAPQDALSEEVRGLVGAPPRAKPGSEASRRRIQELKHVLGDGGVEGAILTWPVAFGKGKARGAGLEGLLYTKLEYEAKSPASNPLIGDYFRQVDALLAAAPWAQRLREKFDALGRADMPPKEKNASLNALLLAAVPVLQEQLRALDPSLWGRQAATYMVLARGYNRLKPGKDFLASFDDAELDRIKNKVHANDIWLQDVFEIGDVQRWGSGGGSPYSIKGYRVKPELGGDEGLRSMVERAHKKGLRVKLDFIPNHTSLDSDMLKARPDLFFHVVPPQNLTDEQVMAAVPKDSRGRPVYRLVRTDGARAAKRILVHHPRPELATDTWVDMAQIDFSKPEARDLVVRQLKGVFTKFGVDSVRRDMSYDLRASRFHERWLQVLAIEQATLPDGWMKRAVDAEARRFSVRWKKVAKERLLTEMTEAAKKARPDAVLIDEAYNSADRLSAEGSDGVYNKNDHDPKSGHFGLYDALRSGKADGIRAALRHAAFRRWQVGGAAAVNYIGTHEEFEGNPVDVFGSNFKAAASTALMLRPVLLFNGLEQGVGQKRNIIADLSKSNDTEKALPFDVPVAIDWKESDPGNQKFLDLVLGEGEKRKDLLDGGVLDVLEPKSETPIVAWTAASKTSAAKLLVAANFGARRRKGTFVFGSALAPLGAFVPAANATYVLRDLADGGAERRVSGAELLAKGLTLALDAGGVNLFEISEEGALAPADGSTAPRQQASAGKPLKVYIAAGESVPFLKTGGLADVVDALARAISKSGHDSTVVLPKYAELKPGIELKRIPGAFAVPVNGRTELARLYEARHEGVRFLFVEHDYYFARDGAYYGKNVDYTDNDERFVFFARAVLEAARFLDEKPDVFHVHDWQAALVAPMLAALKGQDPFFMHAASETILTIHNMAYQGRFPRATLKKAGLDAADFPSKRGAWGFNMLDAGLRKSLLVTTVSPTYAKEIQTERFGEGLHGVLREKGVESVLNGIDPSLNSPATDPLIASRYSIVDVDEGKGANKLALQRQLGLPEDATVPMFAVASRLVDQKGIDWVIEVIPHLAARGAQIVVAGNGDEKLEKKLYELKQQHPRTLALHGFSETFVKQIYAGHDFMLMPSRFEPCGLTQLISQRYGGLPIVTPTGGLLDTVTDGEDGIMMTGFSADALQAAVDRALALYSDKAEFAARRRTAMLKDSSWDAAIAKYLALYLKLKR